MFTGKACEFRHFFLTVRRLWSHQEVDCCLLCSHHDGAEVRFHPGKYGCLSWADQPVTQVWAASQRPAQRSALHGLVLPSLQLHHRQALLSVYIYMNDAVGHECPCTMETHFHRKQVSGCDQDTWESAHNHSLPRYQFQSPCDLFLCDQHVDDHQESWDRMARIRKILSFFPTAPCIFIQWRFLSLPLHEGCRFPMLNLLTVRE